MNSLVLSHYSFKCRLINFIIWLWTYLTLLDKVLWRDQSFGFLHMLHWKGTLRRYVCLWYLLGLWGHNLNDWFLISATWVRFHLNQSLLWFILRLLVKLILQHLHMGDQVLPLLDQEIPFNLKLLLQTGCLWLSGLLATYCWFLVDLCLKLGVLRVATCLRPFPWSWSFSWFWLTVQHLNYMVYFLSHLSFQTQLQKHSLHPVKFLINEELLCFQFVLKLLKFQFILCLLVSESRFVHVFKIVLVSLSD